MKITILTYGSQGDVQPFFLYPSWLCRDDRRKLARGNPAYRDPVHGRSSVLGKRVHAVGVGPKPILVERLTVEKLTRAIAEVDGAVIRKRAQVVSQRIRSEDGIGATIKRVGKYSNDFQILH